MHSALVRVQNVFGFFTTVAFTVACMVALSSFTFPTSPSAEVSLRSVQVVKGRPHYYSSKKEEYAHIKFDLEADFTSLFNWNTKQLFVWVEATYPSLTPEAPPSRAVIWDAIVQSPASAESPWTVDNLRHYLPFEPGAPTSKKAASKVARAKAKAKEAAAKARKAVGGEKAEEGAGAGAGAGPGRISLRNARAKYQITDSSGRLAGRANVTLAVGWNVQPWVGVLTWTLPEGASLGLWRGLVGGASAPFDMPQLKAKKADEAAAAATAAAGAAKTPKAGKAEPVAGRQH